MRRPAAASSGPRGVIPSSRRSGSRSVEQREEVVLVGAATVEEDESALRARRLRDARGARSSVVTDCRAPTPCAGSAIGVSTGSISVAEVLERGRQDQRLAEVRRVLVDREAGPERGDLEEHAARLAEVDRAEPEPVDHRLGCMPAQRHHPLPGLLLVDLRGERDVVHGAGAGDAAVRAGGGS